MKIEQKNINEIINKNSRKEIWENLSTNSAQKKDTIGSKENYKILHSNENANIFDGIESLEDIKKLAELDQVQLVKKQAETVTNTTSAKNCVKMNEEGKSLYDTEVEEVVTVIDKIKIAMAQSKKYQNFGDDLDADAIESATGSSLLANSLISKFQENDIPATQKNISDSLETIERAESLEPLTNGNTQYMIRNQLDPTISNLYKAQHSGSVEYQNPEEDNINWKHIEGAMESVIKEAGYEVNEENLVDAQWIIKSQIPFTKETFQQKKELENLRLPDSIENTIKVIVNGLKEGKRPENSSVVNEISLIQQGQQIMGVVDKITTVQIGQLLEEAMPLTIRGFERLQSQGVNIESVNQKEETKALITATRQLEEIRLKMTLDSTVQMLKQGILVQTKELEQLVESLKKIEKQSYEELFSKVQVEATDKNVQLYQETSQILETIKGVPFFILGRDIFFGVKEVSQEGSKLKADLEKANVAYETLMTAPRKDMGDSIEKAFRNIEDILGDLGLEKTQGNVRAVKILGFNNMEITKESIIEVKEKDIKVQSLMKNLTPSVTLELIREGINPLETEISQLNKIVENIKEKLGISKEEKFSSYLYKLEQNNEILEEERSSYIGIYRLLNQVEKTQGAAIGALVNQDAQITLKNLLTSVRTFKNQGIDVQINNEFGGLEQLNLSGGDITSQIETAYYTQLVGTTLDVMTPNKLKSVVNEQGSFDAVEEMPFEIFAEEIQGAQEEEEIKLSLAKMQLEKFSQINSMEDDVIKILNDYKIPVTMDNLLAAESALRGRGKAYRTLFNEGKKDTDLAEAIKDTFQRFVENLETPEEMAEAQNNLAKTAENVMKGMLEEVEVTSIDVREMKLVFQEIQIGSSLAKDEQYTIPILVGDDVSIMTLKIVRGKEEKGTISIAMETEVTGKLTAKLQVSQESISGYVTSKNEKVLEKLEEIQQDLVKKIKGEPEITLQYIQGDVTKTELFQKEISEEKKENTLQTALLYEVAKEFVTNIQKMFS